MAWVESANPLSIKEIDFLCYNAMFEDLQGAADNIANLKVFWWRLLPHLPKKMGRAFSFSIWGAHPEIEVRFKLESDSECQSKTCFSNLVFLL